MYKRSSIRSIADFLSETMEVRVQWEDIFKVLEELPIKNSGSDTIILQKCRRNFKNPQIKAEGLLLVHETQEMLTGVLQVEMKGHKTVT